MGDPESPLMEERVLNKDQVPKEYPAPWMIIFDPVDSFQITTPSPIEFMANTGYPAAAASDGLGPEMSTGVCQTVAPLVSAEPEINLCIALYRSNTTTALPPASTPT